MDWIKSDSECGFCALLEDNGAALGRNYEAFLLAPVLTVFCEYAAPEVAAFLKDNPLGTEVGLEGKSNASLWLPSCDGMKDCHMNVLHPDPLVQSEEENSASGETLEEESVDTPPKSDNIMATKEEKVVSDEIEILKVQILGKKI